MDVLPEELVADLEITKVTPLSGGDIAQAFRVDTPDGPCFVKTHARPKPQMFEREAAGLGALREAAQATPTQATPAQPTPTQPTPAGLQVPRVLGASSSGLVLEWIDEGRRTPEAERALGEGLARLHSIPQPHFGGIAENNVGYLGSVEVDLTPTDSWPEFYVERRLRPLVERAVNNGVIDASASALFERVAARRAGELCGPAEPPSLVHGDLWGGNRLVDVRGVNWLIDPAAFYAHREVDLAMMLLFGGFGDAVFEAYDAAFPLAAGWRERVPWYQLPPLLVHALLFGGGYGASALRVLESYAR